MPDNVAVVGIGHENDFAESSSTTMSGERETTIRIETISDTRDLSRIGMTISKILSEWEGNGNRKFVCFHSISALLQYVDDRRLFQFLHILQGRLDNVDATAHYHIDPAIHDEMTLSTLAPLFDVDVSIDGDEISVE